MPNKYISYKKTRTNVNFDCVEAIIPFTNNSVSMAATCYRDWISAVQKLSSFFGRNGQSSK